MIASTIRICPMSSLVGVMACDLPGREAQTTGLNRRPRRAGEVPLRRRGVPLDEFQCPSGATMRDSPEREHGDFRIQAAAGVWPPSVHHPLTIQWDSTRMVPEGRNYY